METPPDHLWICGGDGYIFLPRGWKGCYLGKTELIVATLLASELLNSSLQISFRSNGRAKRAVAQNNEANGHVLSQVEMAALVIFLGAGVVVKGINNLTYSMQALTNLKVQGFNQI